jgi:hypothetical protein
MHIFADPFAAPKAGASEAEYEDAVWPDLEYQHSGQKRFRCAVADGATEASYSQFWARLLVKAFAKDRLVGPKREELNALRLRWRRWVQRRLRGPLPWYAEQKAESGAFAALVTLDLQEDTPGQGRWASYALGDSCLVQLRGDELLEAFPLSKAAAFNDRPRLIGSTPADPIDVNEFHRAQGEWLHEDTFYLMSDAISCWFFNEIEVGERPWERLRNLGTPEMPPFRQWLDALRLEKALKNDDVTVLRINIFNDRRG